MSLANSGFFSTSFAGVSPSLLAFFLSALCLSSNRTTSTEPAVATHIHNLPCREQYTSTRAEDKLTAVGHKASSPQLCHTDLCRRHSGGVCILGHLVC